MATKTRILAIITFFCIGIFTTHSLIIHIKEITISETPAGDFSYLDLHMHCLSDFDCFTGAYSRHGFRHPGPGLLMTLAIAREIFKAASTSLFSDGQILLFINCILHSLLITLSFFILYSGCRDKNLLTTFAIFATCLWFLCAFRFERSIIFNYWNPYLASVTLFLCYACFISALFGNKIATVAFAPVAALSTQNHIVALVPCTILLLFLLLFTKNRKLCVFGLLLSILMFFPHIIDWMHNSADSWFYQLLNATQQSSPESHASLGGLKSLLQVFTLPLRSLSPTIRSIIILISFLTLLPLRPDSSQLRLLKCGLLVLILSSTISSVLIHESRSRYLLFYAFPVVIFHYALVASLLMIRAPAIVRNLTFAFCFLITISFSPRLYSLPHSASQTQIQQFRCYQDSVKTINERLVLHLAERKFWKEASIFALHTERADISWCASGELAFFTEKAQHCKDDSINQTAMLRIASNKMDGETSIKWRRFWLSTNNTRLYDILVQCLTSK